MILSYNGFSISLWPFLLFGIIYLFRKMLGEKIGTLIELIFPGGRAKWPPANENQKRDIPDILYKIPASEEKIYSKEKEALISEDPPMSEENLLPSARAIIAKDLQDRRFNDEEKINFLIQQNAEIKIAYIFENINSLIFGSQIEILRYLNSSNGDTKENLKPFYDMSVKKYPSMYKKYPFESYLGFLIRSKLVVYRHDCYIITGLGRALLMYLVRTKQTGFRPL